jgi:hypothetical protein
MTRSRLQVECGGGFLENGEARSADYNTRKPESLLLT